MANSIRMKYSTKRLYHIMLSNEVSYREIEQKNNNIHIRYTLDGMYRYHAIFDMRPFIYLELNLIMYY